jgi:hypothetical protein
VSDGSAILNSVFENVVETSGSIHLAVLLVDEATSNGHFFSQTVT